MNTNIKTRLLSSVAVTALVTGLFSGSVFADPIELNYDLWVDGVRVTSANKDDVLGDSKVKFDADTGVLSFDDATLTKWYDQAFIESKMTDDLTITGKVSIKETTDLEPYGLFIENNITFKNADISVSDTSYGLISSGDFTIIDSKVNFKNISYSGISEGGKFTVSGKNTVVNVDSDYCGIATDSIEISDSATLNVTAKDNFCYYGATFTLNNATFTASGAAYGIDSPTVTIKGDNSVTDIKAKLCGIRGDVITICAGKTTIDATLKFEGDAPKEFPKAAIRARKSLFISYPDTVVEAKGKDVGLAANEYLKIENSKVKCSGDIYAIASDGELFVFGKKAEIVADSKPVTNYVGGAVFGSNCLTIQEDLEIKIPENGTVHKTDYVSNITESDGTTPAYHVVINAHKLTLVPATEPTLDKPGNKEYYKCDDCDDIFADPAGETRLDKDSVIIPKLTPTATPTAAPTAKPTTAPTKAPTSKPTSEPTKAATPTAGATATPTPTVAPADSDSKAQIMEFVKRIYIYVLDREPEEDGAAFWSDELWNFRRTGAEVAQGFIFSPEFEARNTTDEQFVTILYKTFFGRDPEAEGIAFWLDQLSTGAMDRVTVANGFIYSQEWADTCAEYGIRSGGDLKPTGAIAPTEQTYAFVERMYTTAMARGYDEEGKQYWASELANFNVTGEQVGAFFFLSDEMASYNLDDKEFVNRLYKTFMDRESDADGEAYWLGVMTSGTPRTDIVMGFTRSPEFTEKCVEARILPY